MDNNVFIQRIKELRNEAGLKQRELAEKLAVSPGTVGMWETGERKPDYETICKMADIFNVMVDYLLGRSRVKSMQLLGLDDLFALPDAHAISFISIVNALFEAVAQGMPPEEAKRAFLYIYRNG